MKFWTGARVSRGDFFFAFLGINIVHLAALFWFTQTISLMLTLGFRTSVQALGAEPIGMTILNLATDGVLAWFVLRRIKDIDHPGWWMLVLLLLPFVLGTAGGLISLFGMVALFFVPGTRGPNRFGPDPHGFASRADYEEQRRRLEAGSL